MTARESSPKNPEGSEAKANRQSYFDGREMAMVHKMLRREFALLPGVIAGIEAGHHARAQTVGDHLEMLMSVLHHHHRSEDEYVWPLLASRCTDSFAVLMGLMKDQHTEVAARLHDVETALSRWRATASVSSREALVDALDRLTPPLRQHLRDEEDRAVPLMEQYITLAEWNEMVQRGAVEADPEGLALGLGMLMYEGDPEIIEGVLANMPADARPGITALAAQAFAEHSQRIHGTATPRRSFEL